ncbi:c-type cytochrome [Lysinibacillus sp. NPDC097231]|uniref:menaquinol-cytochrome c reductase cytochrome b/c subunit n=1 Tax=Lysinibacillus sp. NPDC097231 TaxID=3364142 RepID=UPI0037F37D9C
MHRGKGMKFVGDSRIKANHRMPNVPKDYSEYPGKTEAFWPNFLLKEWMVGAVFLIAYLLLTVAHPSPLEGPADPTRAYTPLPDWYFLFVYQLLKYSFASGPYNVIGAIVMPGIAFMALLLMPFLDKSPERRPSKRPLPTAFMLLTLAAMFYLTWESVVNHDWEAQKAMGAIVEEVEVDIDESLPGFAIWNGDTGEQAKTCIGCHAADLKGGPAAPALVGNTLTAEEVEDIIHNGRNTMPPGQFNGTDEEAKQLAEFIASLKAKE